jgi:hypothetical protein
MARWTSPDSAGAVDGLNLYVYVSNNPLKYKDVFFFACVTVAFLLYLGLIFTCDDGSATIGVVMFVTKGLGFVIQF